MAEQFYNYNNLEAYLNKMQLCYDGQWLRWVKDIINTKITMFKYENLPGTLTSEIVERALMFNNFLCLWKRPDGEIVMCRWRAGSTYDLYWKPLYVDLLAMNGKPLAYHVPYADIILLRDNPMDIIPFLTLNSYIENIINKENTLNSIFDWISLPVVFAGDPSQAQSLKKVMQKTTKREPFIIAAKNFKDKLEQFSLTLPVKLEEVYNIIKKYKGMAMASMGIYEVDEKRERIVTAEIQSQNDYVDFVYTGMLNERKNSWEEANNRWSTGVILRETYVENQNDNVTMARRMALANDAAKMQVAEINKSADTEVAKIESQAMKEVKPNA